MNRLTETQDNITAWYNSDCSSTGTHSDTRATPASQTC